MVLLHGEPTGFSTPQFISVLEGIIRGTIPANYPEDWDEDFLTRSLLKGLRSDLSHVQLLDQPGPLWIRWRAWKQVGKPEQTFGDIAILVSIRSRTESIEGVGYLEAKRRYAKSKKFDALDFKQCERIISIAPHALLLLYDYHAVPFNGFLVPGMLPPYATLPPVPHRRVFLASPSLPLSTYALVVPQHLAVALRSNDTNLYRFATPLSQQLVGRYLNAHDLEFSPEALAVARGRSRALGSPRYLLVVAVGRGVAPPEPDVNSNVFSDIGGSGEAV